MIDEVIKTIMKEYPSARKENFARNPIANYIRREVPEIFKNQVPQELDLLWVASPGQGQWADAHTLACCI